MALDWIKGVTFVRFTVLGKAANMDFLEFSISGLIKATLTVKRENRYRTFRSDVAKQFSFKFIMWRKIESVLSKRPHKHMWHSKPQTITFSNDSCHHYPAAPNFQHRPDRTLGVFKKHKSVFICPASGTHKIEFLLMALPLCLPVSTTLANLTPLLFSDTFVANLWHLHTRP